MTYQESYQIKALAWFVLTGDLRIKVEFQPPKNLKKRGRLGLDLEQESRLLLVFSSLNIDKVALKQQIKQFKYAKIHSYN